MAAAREVVNLFTVNRGSKYNNGMCTETGILWCHNGHLRRRKQALASGVGHAQKCGQAGVARSPTSLHVSDMK